MEFENSQKDMQIVESWKPFLENENLGQKVKRSDLAWASRCLHNYVDEIAKSPLGGKMFTDRSKDPTKLFTEAENYAVPYASAGSGYTGVDTIAAYGKMLPLLFRRAIPQLIAPVFTGVQPLAGAQGFYVAFKHRYVGYGKTPQIPIGNGFIFVLTTSVEGNAAWAPDRDTAIASFNAANDGHVQQTTTTAKGIVRHLEGKKVLIEWLDTSTAFNATDTLTASGTDVKTPAAKFSNERGYKQFFSNYSYADTTPDFDTAGSQNTTTMSGYGKEIPELGLDFEKFFVQANDRKMKTTFDVATAEDARNNLGFDMMNEAYNMLTMELVLQMNRELIARVRGVATDAGSFDVNTGSDGRWHMEKIRGFLMQLNSQAQSVWEDTRVAPANKLLVSRNVAVALESLPDFNLVNTGGSVALGQTYSGSIGRFEVHTDIFADDEFAMVAYKGEDQIHSGVYYLPYIPFDMATAKHPDQLWDNIVGIRTRYALADNPFGGNLYYRDLTVTGLSDIGI